MRWYGSNRFLLSEFVFQSANLILNIVKKRKSNQAPVGIQNFTCFFIFYVYENSVRLELFSFADDDIVIQRS